jgi:hypothetical protein
MAILRETVGVACMLAVVSSAWAGPPTLTVTHVSFSVKREANGKKYPLPVGEGYALDSDGKLQYSAYFYNMPINMNHNDGIEWNTGQAGRQLFTALDSIVGRKVKGLRKLPDDKSSPETAYVLRVEERGSEQTYVVDDVRSPAWAIINQKFNALVAEFEKATGRPMDPFKLPQAAWNP